MAQILSGLRAGIFLSDSQRRNEQQEDEIADDCHRNTCAITTPGRGQSSAEWYDERYQKVRIALYQGTAFSRAEEDIIGAHGEVRPF